MSEYNLQLARSEINEPLQFAKFGMRRIGLSFEPPKTAAASLRQKMMLAISVVSICYHVFGDVVFIGITMANSSNLKDVIPYFHTFGYGVLRYFGINAIGVWFYNLNPIVMYLYHRWQGQSEAQVGFIWASWYPFDKHQPIGHVVAYIFEAFIGVTCVWITIATDLLFSAMASYICLLLRLLQRRIEAMASEDREQVTTADEYYQAIVANVKLHQRLIKYCNDLEDAFTVSNLLNYVFSSANICCALFVVVFMEPFLAVHNKLFIMSALIQIGMICWYGDEILRANAEVGNAAYNTAWYKMDPKSRRALLFIIHRSQKSTAITAMKFTNMSLETYFTILKRSYSYFALLYTVFFEK